MTKQTVEQRYAEQQSTKGKLKPQDKATMELETKQEQDIQIIFNAIKQSLQESHQAVRQAQTANPTQIPLQVADEKLKSCTQLMQQLLTIAPDMVLGISKGEKQHLKQLDYQIEKATGTLQMLQQSMGSN